MAHVDLGTTAGVREGEVVGEKYLVERILGVGGMGIVVAARHLQLETKVAIKFLLPAMMEHEEMVSRFAREARAAVRITSEHVARVLDVGTLPNGAPYMVMEFLEGGDLGAWLRERGPLPIEVAVDFVLQACVAVAEAHSLGIVHRDLKPSNLFCIRRADGQLMVKVLDFGISKVTAVSASLGPSFSATQTSAVMGSPLYMSPEQMTSAKDVDARTDVWALGIILHELLAGHAPFQGDTLPEMCIRIATRPPETLRSARPEAPADLESIILKCLEKNRDDRYRHVGELAVALSEFGPPRSRLLVDRIVGVLQTTGRAPESAGTGMSSQPSWRSGATVTSHESIAAFGRTNAGAMRRRTVGFIGLAGTVAAAAVVGFILVRPASNAGHTDDPHATASEPVSAIAQQPNPLAQKATPEVLSQPAPALPSLAADPDPTTLHIPQPATSPVASPRTIRRRAPSPSPTPGPSGGATPTTPAPRPPSAVSCDPPFYFDGQGNRVFKPECVN